MFRLSLFILAASLGLTLLVAPRAAPPLGNGAGSEVSFNSVPDRTERGPATEPMSPSWVGATEIQRDASGQFYVDGKVNETATRFLVDTGADMVALTIDDARRAGLWIDPTSFSVVGAGARPRPRRRSLPTRPPPHRRVSSVCSSRKTTSSTSAWPWAC